MRNKLFFISMFVSGVIIGLAALNLYRLTSRNLVLENWLLEQEINDYVAARVIASEARQSSEVSDD